MKKLICLYGGPGTGKSSTAADLFRLAKQDDTNAELVREYIKNWVWEGRELKPGDQIYIAAKQSRAERICLGKLDLIVTDSPVILSQYYEEKYDNTTPVAKHIVKKHEEIVRDAGYTIEHVFLTRVKKYNPSGRFQTEAEAKAIDTELRSFLTANKISYREYTGDKTAAHMIYARLKFDEMTNFTPEDYALYATGDELWQRELASLIKERMNNIQVSTTPKEPRIIEMYWNGIPTLCYSLRWASQYTLEQLEELGEPPIFQPSKRVEDLPNTYYFECGPGSWTDAILQDDQLYSVMEDFLTNETSREYIGRVVKWES